MSNAAVVVCVIVVVVRKHMCTYTECPHTKYVLLSNYSVFGVCSIFDGWIFGVLVLLRWTIARTRLTLSSRSSGGRINSAAALRQKQWSKTTDTPRAQRMFAQFALIFKFGWIRTYSSSIDRGLLVHSSVLFSYLFVWLFIFREFSGCHTRAYIFQLKQKLRTNNNNDDGDDYDGIWIMWSTEKLCRLSTICLNCMRIHFLHVQVCTDASIRYVRFTSISID